MMTFTNNPRIGILWDHPEHTTWCVGVVIHRDKVVARADHYRDDVSFAIEDAGRAINLYRGTNIR